MRASWWQKGGVKELRDERGVVWATVKRVPPYYRVRLLNGPGTPLKKTATLRAAYEVAEDWFIERTK